MKVNFSRRILVGLTTRNGRGWKVKLNDIKKYKIKKFALFTEEIKKKERKLLYKQLLGNGFEIPLVHIRSDTDKKELAFFVENFKTKYFNIHEKDFHRLDKWDGFHKSLCLELNFDNRLAKDVDVDKIGGFCVDLSHFKASEEKWSKEYEYILKKRNRKFLCNHLNGYSYKNNCDLHFVSGIKDFDYLTTLPDFLFSKVIALEMYNSIPEQLKFKEYLAELLRKKS
jgi:hypothetical protein